jgi:SAM-dependent methyltransferase
MNLRIKLGRFFIRLGRFIESLAGVVMRPADLVELNRLRYAERPAVSSWGRESVADIGLTDAEKDLFAQLPIKNGRVLVLDLGGGRDAIALAKKGFEVVGVDFVKDLVAKAEKNAARHGVSIQGLVQEISQLEVPSASFDLALIFAAMYSSIPTLGRRLEMLQRIKAALKPEGYFLCQFLFDPDQKPNRRAELARQAFALLTWGNRWRQPGDVIWGREFMHTFLSEDELRSEFGAAGFEVLYIQPQEIGIVRGAVLQKPAFRDLSQTTKEK